ncbi:MAG: hypothetical protein K2Q32_03960 [Alphaproteobacteria bacterium]|nr:hypothetical protein [Alphaproteobacteria bacterium]
MKTSPFIWSALFLSFGTVLPTDFVYAQALKTAIAAQPIQMQAQVRAGLHDDYERVVFDWPAKVNYSFSQNGPEVTIRFTGSTAIDLSSITKRHLSTIRHSEQMVDAEASHIKLLLAPDIVAKQSQQGQLVIVDFYHGKAPVIDVAASSSGLPQAMLIAGEAPVASQVALPPSQPLLPPANAEIPAQPSLALLPPSSVPVAPNLDDVGTDAVPLVAFDPGIIAGVAVYRRADYVYIVFSKKFTLPLSTMVRDTPRVTMESLQSATGSVYRFYLPQDLNLRCLRDDNKWTISASKKVPTAPISLTVTPQPDYALGARVIIPVSKAEDAVRFTDPEIGDELLIVPLEGSSQAVRQVYHYADFRFVPSEQGVVIHPLVDGLNVKHQNLGIEITNEKGLRLSPSKDTGVESDARANQPMKDQLFDLNDWYGPSAKSFTELRQHWQRTLSEVPPGERDRVRLNMARFYFARNHAHEALGLITLLSQQVPDLLHRSEFLALRGAVRVLTHDNGAIEDLSSPDILNYPEVKLWRAVAKTRSLEWNDAAELFESADAVLARYPEPFFTDFSITAIEAAIANKDRQYASKVLDRLIQKRPDLDMASGPVNYLRGVLMSLTDHLDRAEMYWNKAASGNDRLYRVRAKLSLTDYEVISGKITPLQAAEKLERLRYAWRGDDLELDILRRIGKFYIEGGKMEDGLATLKQALMLLPENDAAKQLHMEMAFAFRDVFLGTKNKDVSALDALSLYERFYDLAPLGAEGDAIIRSLAQRMVSLDLLDRGAALLADQARHRLTVPMKTRVGTQAAGIYLLDHKSDDALSILKDTEDNTAPDDLVIERNLLKAKALSSLDRVQEAKTILKNTNSDYATRLLVDIAWRAHDWAGAAETLDHLIGAPPSDGLKSDTAQLIISRAIALALINDSANLEKLRNDFGSLMKGMPQEELFKTLTESETGLPRDPAAIKSLTADVDLFQGYLENYRSLN